jgi:hypothetical protein
MESLKKTSQGYEMEITPELQDAIDKIRVKLGLSDDVTDKEVIMEMCRLAGNEKGIPTKQ